MKTGSQQRNSIKQKKLVLSKINNIFKSLGSLRKKGKTQIANIRNVSMDIKRIIKEQYEQLCPNIDNIEELQQFLKRHNLRKLTQV